MPGPSAAVVAGSSTTRVSGQRNTNSIVGGQDRHATTTAPSKKKRRTKSELPPKSVTVLPPATTSSFDVKSILPNTKSKKNLDKLRETSSFLHKSSTSQKIQFQCIDGEERTHTREPLIPPALPVNTREAEENITKSSDRREQFKAFGIEAFPTRAIFNDICADFVRPTKWCPKGSNCFRIHPLDKRSHLRTVLKESVLYMQMKTSADSRKESKSKGNNCVHEDAEPVPAPIPKTPHSSATSSSIAPDPLARVKLPAPSASTTILTKAVGNLPAATDSREIVSRHRPTQSLQSPSIPSATDEVVDWATLVKLQKRNCWHNDSSSESDDSDHQPPSLPPSLPLRPRYDDFDPRAWEAHSTDDAAAWSDSNATVEEHRPYKSRFQGPMFPPRPSPVPPPPHLLQKPQTASNRPPTTTTASRHSPLPRLSPPESSPAKVINPTGRVLHPRPRYTERCRPWLHNRCQLGYDCNYVHDDLVYDDVLPEPPLPRTNGPHGIPGSTLLERSMRQGTESYSSTVHNHINLRFSAGFAIDDVTTGFESHWVFIEGLPWNMTDTKLNRLLGPFGEVLEIRRPADSNSAMIFKVRFSRASEAYQAFATLHGTMPFGKSKIELRMAVEGKQNGTSIKDTVVRIDWDYPHRCVYMGYATEELAQQAVEKARTIPYQDFVTTASLFIGIPAVGAVTVKFQGLPPNVTEEGMNIYGTHQGMVTERPTYAPYTPEDTINGIKKFMKQYSAKMVDLEFRPPPYKDGHMRAWAYFNTPNDAMTVADNLHGRKPLFLGHNRIAARHIKTVSFILSIDKFRKVQDELKALQDKIWNNGPGYQLSISDNSSYFTLRLGGENIRILGRLKSELDRILNGELLLDNGKVAWDDYFVRYYGILFLQDLEREYPGVQIQKDLARRTIRMFGVSNSRALVRDKILEKIAELQHQKSYSIPLDGRLIGALLKGEYHELQKKVGGDIVRLDLWHRRLRVRGDEDVFLSTSDMINQIRKKIGDVSTHQAANDECPVCFSEASSPVQLGCGHSYCRACLKHYLKAAADNKLFPLTCLGNEARCKERVPLATAKDLISAGDFHAVVLAAFTAHIQSHPDEFHYCPTPDCPQIYRSAKEGVFIQCPSCLIRICPSCHSDAHDGLTCTESGEGDDLFKDWAGKHDVKQCPGCKIAIEKDEGCNHMVCAMCNTHSCWVCLKTFPNGDGIYGHMRIEHGSFGLGPIL